MAVTPLLLLIVRLLKVFAPVMACAEVPLKVMVPLLVVKVPLLDKSPPIFKLAAVPISKMPEVIVRFLVFNVVVLPPQLNVFDDFATERLLNVWLEAVPLIDCAMLVLLKFTEEVPEVKVAPSLVQSPKTFIAEAFAVKVPDDNKTFPEMFTVVTAEAVPPFKVKSFITSRVVGKVVVPELFIIKL